MIRNAMPWLFSKRKEPGLPWRLEGPCLPPEDAPKNGRRRAPSRQEGGRRWI